MCGIVGYIGPKSALTVIISGLEKLEYRGYDSAGVATINNGTTFVCRAQGKLSELKKVLAEKGKLESSPIGIGHTRWATHGRPSETNAHPHTAGRVSLIHNGIIENYQELKERLKKSKAVFHSETDTEVAAHLLNFHLEAGLTPFLALKATCADIHGSYAFVAIDAKNPDRLLVAKNSTPIIIGLGEGENFVASDITALLEYTRKVLVLEDGDVAEITTEGIRIENSDSSVERVPFTVTWDPVTAQKGGFKHFMLKEIHEQPQAAGDTFRGRIDRQANKIILPEIKFSNQEISSFERVIAVACGTAWHAGLVTKFYFERLARLSCEVDYASEFRYRQGVADSSILGAETLALAISQSGETLDTLAAIDFAKGSAKCAAICNVLGSSLSRKIENTLYTHAGPEVSVASTKAFTTQLIAGYLLAIHFGTIRGTISDEKRAILIENLIHLPAALSEALKVEEQIIQIAKSFYQAKDFLFLGRGLLYPMALEGALKLKEISYIHAEGYPAGEMKHGPIALIDENMPVVVLLQRTQPFFEKALSNLREVESRGGRIIAVTDSENISAIEPFVKSLVQVPFVSEEFSPLVINIPLQLLAYHVAVLNGTDVDLPRNLAKSVTVE